MGLSRKVASFAKMLSGWAGTGPLPQTLSNVDIGDFKWTANPAPGAGWLTCNGAAYSRTTYAALFAAIGTTYGSGDGSTTFNVPHALGRVLVAAGTGSIVEAVPATSVVIAADTLTVASNVDRWTTGLPVVFTTSGSAPGGLVAATTYYVIRVDAVTVKLASTLANAIAGTAINITSQGTGTHTLTSTLAARVLGGSGGEESHAMTAAELPSHSHSITALSSRNTTSGGSETIADTSSNTTMNTNSTGGNTAHNNMPPYLVGNLFIYAGA